MRESIPKLILEYVDEHPADLVSFVALKAKVTRAAVHRHVVKLLEVKTLKNTSTRKTRPHYQRTKKARRLASSHLSQSEEGEALAPAKEYLIAIVQPISEDDVWLRYLQPDLRKLKANVFQICQYGFTEMFNNVIDHSEATRAKLVLRQGDVIEMQVWDKGVGIFEKIQRDKKLPNAREAILHLSKGKLTTDPVRHTGQGIFFTSRAFDEFSVSSNYLSFVRRAEGDWFLEDDKHASSGTIVRMKINCNSLRRLEDTFRGYTLGDDMDFNKTHALVALSKYNEENFISRSQAKRLLVNFEKFLHVTLDFRGVSSVGQGFVDEIFRVFKNYHPQINIDYMNANENIEFMIKRGL